MFSYLYDFMCPVWCSIWFISMPWAHFIGKKYFEIICEIMCMMSYMMSNMKSCVLGMISYTIASPARPCAGWSHQTEEGSSNLFWNQMLLTSESLLTWNHSYEDIYSLLQAYRLTRTRRWQPVQAWKIPRAFFCAGPWDVLGSWCTSVL